MRSGRTISTLSAFSDPLLHHRADIFEIDIFFDTADMTVSGVDRT